MHLERLLQEGDGQKLRESQHASFPWRTSAFLRERGGLWLEFP